MTDVLVPGQLRCSTCNAPYRPHLTAGACPVCDTAAPAGSVRRPRFAVSPDDRLMGIVALATVLNVLLLGLLAALAVHS